MELQGRLDELREQGIGVAAISYDSEEVLAAFSERRGITFPLLSDDDSEVITEFGILNTVAYEAQGPNSDDPGLVADVARYVSQFSAAPRHLGTPHPGTFMLDRTGRVTSRFFEEFYRERNTTANVMLKLGFGLSPIAAIKGSTAHLKLTAYPSDPGQVDGSHPAFAELTLDRVATVKGKQRPVPQARDRDRSGVRAARSPFADYFGRIVPPDWC